MSLQLGLFDASGVGFDASFSGIERIELEPGCWLDCVQGWVRGSDELFEEVARSRKWSQRTRWMYEQRVREPRLTSPWNAGSGEPLRPAVLDEIRLCLSARYGVHFDQVGFNYYRDGQTQRTWNHSVPKVAEAGPRISLAFRYGLDPRAYSHKRDEEADRVPGVIPDPAVGRDPPVSL